MKKIKSLFLLVLITSFFLTACDEGGFGIASNVEFNKEETQQTETNNNNDNQPNTHSGATGANDDNTDQHSTEENPSVTPGEGVEEPNITVVDLGSKIINFKSTCLKADKTSYVNVSFESDPFNSKYDFAYYTVNDQKLGDAETKEQENIDNKITYKLFLGSTYSGTYVIKFYNSKKEQYGSSDLKVDFGSELETKPYISVAFNLVQIRFVSIGFGVRNIFKKIENFFNEMFNQDKMAM